MLSENPAGVLQRFFCEVAEMMLRVAVGQFPVDSNIQKNRDRIERQIASAASQRADVILFPESALSGYAGRDFGGIVSARPVPC